MKKQQLPNALSTHIGIHSVHYNDNGVGQFPGWISGRDSPELGMMWSVGGSGVDDVSDGKENTRKPTAAVTTTGGRQMNYGRK